MNRLRALTLRPSYRTGEDDLVGDFYVPCLEVATLYQRAVGFFTSGALALAGKGLSEFVLHDGLMELVASPRLSPEDVEAIKAGYAVREERLTAQLLSDLDVEKMPDPERDRLGAIAWLVSNGRLQIKLAVLEHSPEQGLYHEKVGIFSDGTGDSIVFSGSSNESFAALSSNFESFEVFRSWDTRDTDRVERRERQFRQLWDDSTPGLRIFEFPRAVHERLLELAPSDPPKREQPDRPVVAPRRTLPGLPVAPPGLELRPYQRNAISSWWSARGRGVWAMATGTGKTITAIAAIGHAAAALWESHRPLLAVVVCPFLNLVDQWCDELRRFGLTPIRCADSVTTWVQQFEGACLSLRTGTSELQVVVVSNATFAAETFQSVLASFREPILLVGDEVHNLGAATYASKLPSNALLRLGLSATPRRWGDEEGTAEITRYFGEVCFTLDLGEAISMGALTPYVYTPVLVTLNQAEEEQYQLLSAQIGKLAASLGEGDSSWSRLLFKRARLLGGAANKLPALHNAIAPLRQESHQLVYCSDATWDPGELGEEDSAPTRQLDAVVQLLGARLRMKVAPYTSREPTPTRRQAMEAFERASIQALVAIRCLDEGVDIPSIQRAFILASSQNPKQFIQRRGRVLRRSPGKVRAEIYDFIVVPDGRSLTGREFDAERKILRRELQRVVEFACLADNGDVALSALAELRMRYNLMDIGLAEETS